MVKGVPLHLHCLSRRKRGIINEHGYKNVMASSQKSCAYRISDSFTRRDPILNLYIFKSITVITFERWINGHKGHRAGCCDDIIFDNIDEQMADKAWGFRY